MGYVERTPSEQPDTKVAYVDRGRTPEITEEVVEELQACGFEIVDLGEEAELEGEDLHDYRTAQLEEVEKLAREYKLAKRRQKRLPFKIGALAVASPVASFGSAYGLVLLKRAGMDTGIGIGTLATVWSEVGVSMAAGVMYGSGKDAARGAAVKAREIRDRLGVSSDRWINDELGS